jgi:hypothetical protein
MTETTLNSAKIHSLGNPQMATLNILTGSNGPQGTYITKPPFYRNIQAIVAVAIT